jgi:protocatechuate 3,4-dioxygenase beta subunit
MLPHCRTSAVLLAALCLPALAFAQSTLQVAAPGEPGTRLTVSGVVQGRDGKPIAGVDIHVYQTDAQGRYTPDKPMDEPHARLAGHVRTDAAGRFELRTIRPGGYPQTVHLEGRDRHIPAHIHLDLTAPGHPARRLQMVFADDPLVHDPYWKKWIDTHGHPVLDDHPAGEGLAGNVTLSLD